MSKTTWVVIAIVILAGGYYILKGPTAEENLSPEQANQTEEKKMAFSEFVKQGGSYKCEVKQNVSDMQNSGTVYMAGGMLRGNFTTIAEGRNMDTSFIFRDGYSYTWNSFTPGTGFKIKEISDTNVSGEGSASGTYSWDASQIGDYNCVAWTADSSVFAVPTNVAFQEIEPK